MNHFVTILCLFVVSLFSGTFAHSPDCGLEKDSGNGKDAIQKYYFNSKWHTCFGFKYTGKGGNGNRFDSYSECQGNCAPLDGSACSGPNPSKSPLNEGTPDGFQCETAKCPKGYKCAFGTIVQCCFEKDSDDFNAATSDKCPDGSKAGDAFGETCNDLVCNKGQKCVQINKQFAKCCGGK
uniref:BPTI/Kunitz inhibitor domain-containing protein n=1 Tax=Panagrolaimus davidi TaxID=227884 RepID=A0A914QKE1_9BILA